MSKENVDLTMRAVAAINQRDPDAFAELCDPEVEIVPLRAAMEDTVYRGRDAASRFFAALDQAWEDLILEDAEARDLGERVLLFATLGARGRASGAMMHTRVGGVLHIRDGLITMVHTYPSRAEALEAAGLSE